MQSSEISFVLSGEINETMGDLLNVPSKGNDKSKRGSSNESKYVGTISAFVHQLGMNIFILHHLLGHPKEFTKLSFSF